MSPRCPTLLTLATRTHGTLGKYYFLGDGPEQPGDGVMAQEPLMKSPPEEVWSDVQADLEGGSWLQGALKCSVRT